MDESTTEDTGKTEPQDPPAAGNQADGTGDETKPTDEAPAGTE